MPQDATAFYEFRRATMSIATGRGHDACNALGPFCRGVVKDEGEGGLTTKFKELIALSTIIASGCKTCISIQNENCLKAGATPR